MSLQLGYVTCHLLTYIPCLEESECVLFLSEPFIFKTHHYRNYLSGHYILSREWRVIVDLVQINYHGRPVVLKSVRCNRAVDNEGSSLCSGVIQVS